MISWMLYGIVVATVLGAAAAAGERVLIAAGRSTRWIWAGVILGSLALPVVLPQMGRGGAGADLPTGGASGAVVGEIEVLATTAGASSVLWVERALALGWLTASAVLGGLFIWSLLVLRLRRRGWKRERVDGVPMLVSEAMGPALVGFVSPELVVPAWILEWDARSLGLLVAHEEEHRAARDPLLLLLGMMAVVAMPWNLPLWWQTRRLRLATEMDCDARVLRRHASPREYGLLLLEVGSRASSGRMAATAFSEPRSSLERRVSVLMGREALGRRSAALLAGLAIAGAAVACAIPAPDAPAADTILGPRAAGDAATEEPPAGVMLDVGDDVDTIPEIGSSPAFTPYEVKPELRNRQQLAQLLEQAYPPMLRDAGVGGTTVLWMFVDHTGAVRNTRVARSSGYEELDAAAEEVARQIVFAPALNRGAEVPVWIQLPITFSVRPAPPSPAPERPPLAGVPTSERPPSVPAAPEPVPGRADPPPSPVGERPPPTPAAPPEVAPEPAAEVPRFTPYEVRPEIRNREELRELLERNYPPMLKDAGVGGTSTYWVQIDETGRVARVRLTQPSGYEELDRAGRDVLLQVRFTPALNRGRPVPVWIQLPVTFQVRPDRSP